MTADRISAEDAKHIGDVLGVNFDAVGGFGMWRKGMIIELEHGRERMEEKTPDGERANLTDDDLLATGQIALAHVMEYPDYYERLIGMEKEAELFWAGRAPKPRVTRDIPKFSADKIHPLFACNNYHALYAVIVTLIVLIIIVAIPVLYMHIRGSHDVRELKTQGAPAPA